MEKRSDLPPPPQLQWWISSPSVQLPAEHPCLQLLIYHSSESQLLGETQEARQSSDQPPAPPLCGCVLVLHQKTQEEKHVQPVPERSYALVIHWSSELCYCLGGAQVFHYLFSMPPPTPLL